MKKNLLLLVFVLQTIIVFGQPSNYNETLKTAMAEATKDTEEGYRNAAKMLEPYADIMNGADLNRMGFYFWKTENYSQSLKYFKLSTSKGDNGGIHNLGYAYENGHGVEIDKNLAFFYYIKIKPDYEEINEVYHKIGHLCEQGYNNYSNNPDYLTASEYFIKGADLGNAECMRHLGDYYNESGRLATNLKLAIQWYEKACSADVKEACEALKKLNPIEKNTPDQNKVLPNPNNQSSEEIFEATGSIIVQNGEEIKKQKMLFEWDYVQFNSASETKVFLEKNGYNKVDIGEFFSKEGGSNVILYHPNFENKYAYLRLLENYSAKASLQEFSQNGYPFFPVNKLLENIKFVEGGTNKILSSIELPETIAKAVTLKGEVTVAYIYSNGNMAGYKFFIDKDDFSGALLVQDLGFKKKGEFNPNDYQIQYRTIHPFGITQRSTDKDDLGKINPF